MNKAAFLVLSLLLGLSCTKKSEYLRKSESIFINPNGHGIPTVRVISWKVGRLFKEEVSKGISVTLRLPVLDRDQLKEIFSERQADSYLVRVSRKGLYGTQIIDHTYIPFVARRSGHRRFSPPKGGTINIYYSAAAMSKRFENFYCPAFGHNKIVKKVEIIEHADNVSGQLVLSPLEETRVTEKMEELTITPFVINGGETLVDEYTFEIAFFSRHDKMRRSNFITLPQGVKVFSEEPVALKGCAGFEIPKKPEDPSGVFKFGR